MAIGTYAELQAKTKVYAKRSGLDVVDFITLCEQRIRSGSGKDGDPFFCEPLRTQKMVIDDTVTILSGNDAVSLPSGWLKMATPPYVTFDSQRRDLTYVVPSKLNKVISAINNESVDNYTIVGDELRVPGSVSENITVSLSYYGLTSLSDVDTTNVVLTNYPSIYLFGTLLEIALFIEQDDKAQRYFQSYKSVLHGANDSDEKARYSGMPLIIKSDTDTP